MEQNKQADRILQTERASEMAQQKAAVISQTVTPQPQVTALSNVTNIAPVNNSSSTTVAGSGGGTGMQPSSAVTEALSRAMAF